MIALIIGLPVMLFLIGFVVALGIERDRRNGQEFDDDDNTPTIMIGQKVPDPFESFHKKK